MYGTRKAEYGLLRTAAMSDRSMIERLTVHESIENVVPKQAFVNAFDELTIPATLVGDDETYGETDAVVSYVPRPEFLDAAWVHCARAGYDEFNVGAYESASVPLTNSEGIHAATVGELAVGYMLSFARLHHLYRDHQNESEWYSPDYERPFTIENERLCVLGLGTLGTGIAQRGDALGMEVIGVRRSDESVPGVDAIYDPTNLLDAIAEARFIAVAVPHTSETENMISTAELTAMREDAYLLNVARGPIVDEDALIDALDTGMIAGAGLDVFETEPLDSDSPLWEFNEVIISPHKGSATNRYHLDIAELVSENVRRFQSDKELRNRVA
jgi:D-2-hydroxyacid dehydrogenase (NADP+)